MSLRTAAVVSVAVLAGCAPAEPARVPAGLRSPFSGYASPRYAAPSLWVCRPDLPSDPCRGDLTATEIRADGTRAIVRHVAAKDPGVDCFYVYPTVDSGFFAKNHTDFEDRTPMVDLTLAQAARFTEACRVYVPLYRQVSIGTYVTWHARRESFLSVAFSDVEDAFLHYMGQHNRGRKVVLIGHSQGAEMVVRLLRKRFDHDPAMRDKLVVAFPIGGRFEVRRGHLVGATLEKIPLCSAPDETGCVVAFRSHRAGEVPDAGWSAPPRGVETACVNPAGDGHRPFSRLTFPMIDRVRRTVRGVDDVKTPYVVFPDLYTGRCVDGVGGFRYLEVRSSPGVGDRRTSPIPLERWIFGTSIGLHVLDMQFPQGDMIDLVKRKAAAKRGIVRP